MKSHGFREIGDWHINKKGKLDVNFPSSLENIPGVIAILVNDELMFFSSTSHYGPRIRDFKHSINGEKTKVRIHTNIVGELNKNKQVSLWVLNTLTPVQKKRELIIKFRPSWNLQ